MIQLPTNSFHLHFKGTLNNMLFSALAFSMKLFTLQFTSGPSMDICSSFHPPSTSQMDSVINLDGLTSFGPSMNFKSRYRTFTSADFASQYQTIMSIWHSEFCVQTLIKWDSIMRRGLYLGHKKAVEVHPQAIHACIHAFGFPWFHAL